MRGPEEITLRDVVAAIVDGEGSPTARLKGAIGAFARRALRGRRLAYALIAEPCDPEIDRARLHWRAALGEEFVRLIALGQEAGTFRRGDPRTAASCVVGAVMEALVGPLTPAVIADDAAERLVADVTEACLAIVTRLPARGIGRIA